MAILLFVSTFLFACSPYPPCDTSSNCFLIGENQEIKIPVLVPITSTNILYSQEIQKAIDLAYKENIWISENVELTFIDNFDSPQENNNTLQPFLESTDIPMIFCFLSTDGHIENNSLLRKTGKVLIYTDKVLYDEISINSFFPDLETLNKQALNIISDNVYTKELIVFSDIITIQNDLVNFCDQKNVICYQFDSTNSDLIHKMNQKESIPVALISQKPLILDWLVANSLEIANPIMIFDTSFSNPQDFQTIYNDISWIGPDIWFNTSLDKNSISDQSVEWNYMQTALTYRQLNIVFQALQSQISDTRNGFRQFDPTIFIEQFKKNNLQKEITIRDYFLEDNQFILVNEPAMESK